MKRINYSDTTIILFYIILNSSYALFSFPTGKVADRIGLENVIAFGLLTFSMVCVSINFAHTYFLHIFIFALYSLFDASPEGISKALITNIVSKDEIGTALGTYNAFSSIAIPFVSSIAGAIWAKFSSTRGSFLSGSVSLSIFFYFAFLKIKRNEMNEIDIYDIYYEYFLVRKVI